MSSSRTAASRSDLCTAGRFWYLTRPHLRSLLGSSAMRTRRIFGSLVLVLFAVVVNDAQAQTPAASGSSTIRIGIAASTEPTNDRYPEYPVRRTGGESSPMP